MTDNFDGVEVIRFPMEIPADLSYGHVAQSHVSWLGKFARLTVMASYLDAQYRATLAAARERKADVVHAHWAIPTGPAAVLAAKRLDLPSVITMHGGDVYVNLEQDTTSRPDGTCVPRSAGRCATRAHSVPSRTIAVGTPRRRTG